MKNIIFIFLAFTILTFTSCSSDSIEETTAMNEIAKKYRHSNLELELLDEINAYRVSIGLNALEIIEHISFKSNEHNEYMISIQNVNHNGFNERKINLQKVLGAEKVGENVAYGFSSAKATVIAWTNSPSHKANLEGNYTHFGASVKSNIDGKKYYTNMFIKK